MIFGECNMKILILGSSGFIGRNLKEYFELLGQYDLLCPSHSQLDILDENAVDNYLRIHKPDVVINAAICRNPRYFSSTQSMGELEQDLRMFFNFEKRQDMFGKMICFGSGAEFGKQNYIVSVNEGDFPLDLPINEYGIAKYTICNLIENSKNIYNLRVFGLFGKYENWRTTFISGACCKAIFRLPITIRQNVVFDYLYINDFCSMVNTFINSTPVYHTYNATSGRKIELIKLAEIIKKVSGHDELPIYICKPGYGNEYTASNSRFINEFGKYEFMSYDDSISDLLEYYNSISNEIDLMSLLYQ